MDSANKLSPVEMTQVCRLQHTKNHFTDANGNSIERKYTFDNYLHHLMPLGVFTKIGRYLEGVQGIEGKYHFLPDARVIHMCKDYHYVAILNIGHLQSGVLDEAGFENAVTMLLAEDLATHLERQSLRLRHVARHCRGRYMGDCIGVRKISVESVSLVMTGN